MVTRPISGRNRPSDRAVPVTDILVNNLGIFEPKPFDQIQVAVAFVCSPLAAAINGTSADFSGLLYLLYFPQFGS